MNAPADTPAPSAPDRLAAALRTSVGDLIRVTRSTDRIAPAPASVLDLLDRNGAMTTAELAARRGVRHQTMAVTVRELMDEGYLAAGPDPSDARKKLLALTAAGTAVLTADRRHRVETFARTLAETLDEDERRTLADALPLIDRLTAAIAQRGPRPPIERGTVHGAW
jgi:DNA-binding MarR family transcriptional regulator